MHYTSIAAISVAIVLCAVNCGPKSDRQSGNAGDIPVDSTTAVSRAIAVVQAGSGSSAHRFALAGLVRDSAGVVVALAPVCDTTAGVDSTGRPFRRGCGGGDYTVRVRNDGVASIVARGQ